MNNTNALHTYILHMSNEFSKIYETYLSDKYRQERQDRKYKDDESNIFDEQKYTYLREFITTELNLFIDHGMHYEEIKNRVDSLHERIKSWMKDLLRRKIQGIGKAKALYDSEVYFLNDFKIQLKYKSKVLSLLIELENIEAKLLSDGRDISLDPEYEVYLLNKCILINQVGYCKTTCDRLLGELNNRVNNCKAFTADFYYQLGTLNFELQKYEDARKFIEYTIDVLEGKFESFDESNEGFRYSDMLFAAYQMQALSYEFCGDPLQAIKLLTLANYAQDSECDPAESIGNAVPERILEIFKKELLKCGGINKIIFSNCSTVEEKQRVVETVERVIENIEFDSPIFNYVKDANVQKRFAQAIQSENERLRQKLNAVIGVDGNESDIEKIYQENCIDGQENFIINEFLHILAHCINEFGVQILKRNSVQPSPKDEELSYNLIVIARALMLYVSNKRSIYKTCFATIYAEAGDFHIAKQQLHFCFESDPCFDDFANTDVTTKAEIAFFYYIIDGISQISSGIYMGNDSISNLHNRYLNYCYRNFDYDAIAHIKLYEFKFEIAKILRHGDMSTIIDEFKRISNNADFIQFTQNTHFENCNKRLSIDYEKTKYTYNFLHCLLVNSGNDSNGRIVRDATIWDIACKYMHYYNASHSGMIDSKFKYIDFSDIDLAIKQSSEIFKNLSIDNSKFKIDSDDCQIYFIKDDDGVQTLLEEILKQQSTPHKLWFIACADESLCKRCEDAVADFAPDWYHSLRFFSSFKIGYKEFILYNTYFIIKKDFSDPQTIFVMTPINTAKSCKYSLYNQVTLIEDGLVKPSELDNFGSFESMLLQFAKMSDSIAQERRWTDALFTYAKEDISFVANVFYEKDSRQRATKYKYYSGNFSGEAVLFKPDSALKVLGRMYTRQPTRPHPNECQSPRHLCTVCAIERNNEHVDELMQSFGELSLNDVSYLLLWKGESGGFISWRIVALKSSFTEIHKEERINRIKQMICGFGCELSTERIHIAKPVVPWPAPIDIATCNKPFLFISHMGKDDELVKSELISFFAKYQVPIWYDKERLIGDDSWKNKVASVINHKNCVGCVLLITRKEYFTSEAIQYELLLTRQKKDVLGSQFYIYPIVYGFAHCNDEIDFIIRNSVSDIDHMNKIHDLIVPTNGKVNTFLDKGQSLYDYTSKEKGTGRDGAILLSFKDIGLI